MHARRRGVDVRWFNLLTDPVPAADYVVMASSLYHFADRADEILDKLRRAARRAVIISEPVRNLSDLPLVGGAMAALTSAGVGDNEQRFNLTTFTALARRHGVDVAHESGDRNAIAVFPAII
jgi:hypothetical protein